MAAIIDHRSPITADRRLHAATDSLKCRGPEGANGLVLAAAWLQLRPVISDMVLEAGLNVGRPDLSSQ